MKTPMQELMDEFAKKADSLPDTLDANAAYLVFQECYDMAKSMLEKEMKPKYFERNQARIVFYAIQMAIDSGAKYIYMTDADEIIAFKEPMKPREIELSKSELVLTL
jgi:hypothetical protein